MTAPAVAVGAGSRVVPAGRAGALDELLAAAGGALRRGEPVPCRTGAGDVPAGAWLSPTAEVQRRAAAACAGCAVLTECRDYVAAWPEAGAVWAGTTERERDERARAERRTSGEGRR